MEGACLTLLSRNERRRPDKKVRNVSVVADNSGELIWEWMRRVYIGYCSSRRKKSWDTQPQNWWA